MTDLERLRTPADYSDRIAQPSRRRVLIVGLATAAITMAMAAWRLRTGLAIIGDSGSYLAGASAIAQGRFFETPLVASFSELSLIDTVRNAGWSPYADFGIGLPFVIALFDLVLPLTTAAALVNLVSIGAITAGVVIGPWSPRRSSELWFRSVLGIALSCWPILRFTSAGVLSEPLFCAAVIWLVIMVVRRPSPDVRWLVAMGLLTVLIGMLRFVGPIVAVVVAVLLVQRGLRWRRAATWGTITAIGPLVATVIAAGGTRKISFHSLDSTDVFFTSRGIGGWFEASSGDQTATLLRMSFRPDLIDWMITSAAAVAACIVIWAWVARLRRRTTSPLEPTLVLAMMLALAVIPSMVFIDAVVKLENRILMPSGLLVISAAGWWFGRNSSTAFAWCALAAWTVVATHPWQWLERPEPPQPTNLTDVVRDLDPAYVVTNNADLVWWMTRTPARYLPDGYHDLSDRFYDTEPIMSALPCDLAATGGLVVVDTASTAARTVGELEQLVESGDFERRDVMVGDMASDIVAYVPTNKNC